MFRELEKHGQYRSNVLVTNDTQLSAEDIWRTYRPQANEDNCIKELKEGYGWHQFNARKFSGTKAAMLVGGWSAPTWCSI